jgi:translation initiation factor 2B subunit (eIF-2B alpha/beta/delta family)
MIRNLQDEAGKRLVEIVEKSEDERSGAVDNLRNYLKVYLSKIESNCEKMTEAARGLIESGDVLIIHGYSIKVEKFLETIKPPTHQGAIYVVNCNKPHKDELHFGPHENERMLRNLIDFGYKVYSIGLESLSQVLADSSIRGLVCKMLIGTHAILGKNSLLCKAGTHSLVLTGKAHGIPVIAFASTDKFLQNGSREKDFDVNGYLAVKEKKVVDQKHDVSCIWSKMDKVPFELVDKFVTEAGVKPSMAESPIQ